VVRKRAESGALMAMLLLQHAGSMGAQTDNHIKATSHFAVGGVGQTVSAWLDGELEMDSDQLVEQLASTLDQLSDPRRSKH
jgi:hypothetical protein